MAHIGVLASFGETIIYSQVCTKGYSSECALQYPPPSKVKSKPRAKALSSSELLRYSQERRTLVVQLHEAARELSALLREMSLLLASHNRENRYQ